MRGLYKYLIKDKALIYFVKKVCKALKRAGRLVSWPSRIHTALAPAEKRNLI